MTKSALKEHLRIHRNEKTFRCDDCEKYFRHKHGLVTHQRNRKYPCNVKKQWENMCRADSKVQHFRKVKSTKRQRNLSVDKNEKLQFFYQSLKATQTTCREQNQSRHEITSHISDENYHDSTNPSSCVTRKEGFIKDLLYPSYTIHNNVITTKASQTKESVDEPNENNIIKQSYYSSTFLVEQNDEFEQETNCQQIVQIKQPVSIRQRNDGSQVNINPIIQNACAQIYESDKTVLDDVSSQTLDDVSSQTLDDVSSQTSASNETETESECLPGLSISGKTDNESGQENTVNKEIRVLDKHYTDSNREKQVRGKSGESFHRQATVSKENRDSDLNPTRQRPNTMINEEEIIKIIKKIKRKDFRCARCSRTFVNDYCLSGHACKSISHNKLITRRINCDICHKSYANKYLHAGHSCKPSKTNKKRQKPVKKLQNACQREPATQITGILMRSDKTKTSYTEARTCVDRISNVSPSVTKAAKRNKQKDKAIVADSQCNNRIKDDRFKNEKSEKVSIEKPKYRSAGSIETRGKNDAVKDVINDEDTETDAITDETKALMGSKETLICEICGKVYKNNTNLKRHSCKPPSVDTRTCNICNKTFNLKVHLQIHMRIHTKEYPFLCKSCGKLFNQRANLMKHMRIHEPQKKFQCEICQRRFTQKAALLEHLIVHTSIKAYTCMKCGKKFRHKHGLQNHLKRKFPCDLKQKKETKCQNEGFKKLNSAHCEETTGRKARTSALSQIENENAKQRSKDKCIIQKDVYDLGKHSKVDVLPALEKVVDIETPLLKSHDVQLESSIESVTINDCKGRLESINDTVNLKDVDSSESQLARSSLVEGRPAQNCELFVQQPQARYITSYHDQTGWIPLNYKLAEL